MSARASLSAVVAVLASLFVVFAFAALPAQAQGPGGPPPNYQQLVSQLAALTQRVAKLEGDIVASDLAGTYSFMGLNTTMRALRAGPPIVNATISTEAFRATLTLNANGTGNVSAGPPIPGLGTCGEGSTLTQGTWAMHGFDCSGPAPDVTWTYADGVITITFLDDGDEIPFNVALGGRLLMVAFAPFHPDPFFSSNQTLLIATRLQ